MDTNYKRTVAGSVGAGMGAIFNGSGRKYYILEHKTESKYHHLGESQKIIIDQVELGRDSSCQVRFGDDFPTVSHKHAAIVREGDGWKLIHLSQTNNTYVNGQPVSGEYRLSSGDEIRLSSNGPVMGFIVPQGARSVVSSIGLTERMNLFRQQALRPYKTALSILGVLLVLVVGGLVLTRIDLGKANDEINDSKATIAQMTDELNVVNSENEALEVQIADMKKSMDEVADKNSEDYRKLSNKYYAALAKQSELQNKTKELEEKIDKVAEASTTDVTAPAAEKEASTAPATSSGEKSSAVVPVAQENSTPVFASVEECSKYVFYVRMDDLEVFSPDNASLVKFTTDGVVGGTGFLMDNGVFATARRVVEPWYYYKGKLGKDNIGRDWAFEDIQVLANLGYKIVAHYSAYSPKRNFKFTNTDVRKKASIKFDNSVYTSTSYVIVNKTIKKLVSKKTVTIYYHTNYAASDWASFNPGLSGGLKFDDSWSQNPKREEVKIIGFPRKEGYVDSQAVNPVIRTNAINNGELNLDKVIELATKTYEVGNDGGPVLVNIDGDWTVVGILSHTDDNGRDYAVPVGYIIK